MELLLLSVLLTGGEERVVICGMRKKWRGEDDDGAVRA